MASEELFILCGKDELRELTKSGAVRILSGDYAILKDGKKAAEVFKTTDASSEMGIMLFEKPLREITAKEIEENKTRTYFKKSKDEHRIYKVIDGQVGEYKLRSFKTYELYEAEGKREAVLSDLDKCHKLNLLSESITNVKRTLNVKELMFIEGALMDTSNRNLFKELNSEKNASSFIEELNKRLQKEILIGRTPDLSFLTPQKMKITIGELRKFDNHKEAEGFIKNALDIYIKRKITG